MVERIIYICYNMTIDLDTTIMLMNYEFGVKKYEL